MKNYIISLLLVAVVILGFQMRMKFITEAKVETPICCDTKDYLFYGYNLKFNHIYSRDLPNGETLNPDAVRSPGYPFFISLFLDESLSSLSLKKVVFAQALLSTFTIVLSYFVFSAYMSSTAMAFLATLFVALSPHLIVANIYLLSESVFCFILMLTFYFLCRFYRNENYYTAIVLGILLAFATLTKPWLKYFLFVLVLYFLATERHIVREKSFIYLFIGYLVPVFLWGMRNFSALGVVSDDTLTINTLHHGLYPYFMYNYDPNTYGFPYRYDPNSNQIATSVQTVLSEIYHRFEDSPLEYFLWYFVGKPIELFSWDNDAQAMGDVYIYRVINNPYINNIYFQWPHDFLKYLHAVVIFLYFISIALVWAPLRRIGIARESVFIGRCVGLLCIYFTLIHCAGAPYPRYTIPMLPFIYGMAMFSLVIIYKYLSAQVKKWVGTAINAGKV